MKHNSYSKEIWNSSGNCVQMSDILPFLSLVALSSKLQYNTASVEMVLDNKTIHVEDLVFTLYSSGFFYFGLALVSTWGLECLLAFGFISYTLGVHVLV